MGEHHDLKTLDDDRLREFMRALLEDLRALERMISEGLIESGVRRIGAEQEIFLVDSECRVAPTAPAILEELDPSAFTPELARFNLEANLSPRKLEGDCLSQMEKELDQRMSEAREAAHKHKTETLLVGILPTLYQSDLSLENMSPRERYFELNRVIRELRGGEFHTFIKGLDELQVTHDNVMMEACNTSFQIHFQVGPEEFARLYNLAQVVTGPVMAVAVNSAVLLQHRLWKETRVALFQQSLDIRNKAHQARGSRQRVHFGDRWVRESVLEIYREDVARFRALLSADLGESSMAMLDRGVMPPLKALCLHNGTVYRWNRPCYGVHENQAHLRIENRVLPAGPTVLDEVANAALYFGLMSGLDREIGDVTRVFAFDDAKGNFMAAARYGLNAQLKWLGGKTLTARELLLDHLLPLARRGLESYGIDGGDIDRYLGVISDRARTGRTGAQWMLDSLAAMDGQGTVEERHRSLTRGIMARQRTGLPVHEWDLVRHVPRTAGLDDWLASYRTVGQMMTRDVFTVRPGDLVDLAASMMDWEHVRHVPVEDDEGQLVGILSHRALLRLISRRSAGTGEIPKVAIREVMRINPVTISPKASTLEAIELMREHKVGCLPVVEAGGLVGLVTEHDFFEVSARLLEEKLRQA